MDLIHQLILCAKCKDICIDPFETLCCGLLYCNSCLSGLSFICDHCKIQTKTRKSFIMHKVINEIQLNCQYCGLSMEAAALKLHYKDCELRQAPCKYCNDIIIKKFILDHLAESHLDFILKKVSNFQGNKKDILRSQKNGLGRMASIGSNGKFYCGDFLDVPCGCCGERCGPFKGCNCSGCQALDMETRNLQDPFYVNREGAICKNTALGFYCGRQVLKNSIGQDGYCGPTNGPNCDSCKIFQKFFIYLKPTVSILRNR